jgi:hypothetical protein
MPQVFDPWHFFVDGFLTAKAAEEIARPSYRYSICSIRLIHPPDSWQESGPIPILHIPNKFPIFVPFVRRL